MFSEHEKIILKHIGRKKVTVHELTCKFYGWSETTSQLSEQNYVAGVIRRINAKCRKEQLKWSLLSKGVGRGGKTVWRGKRERTKN
jgi:hypothetical protein